MRTVAARLRDEALQLAHDTFLGGEDDLVRRFNVSRPTFRQAAKLLEQERLLKIKRGVGGGYFVQRPTSDAVAHMTAIYLHSRKATLQHLVTAAAPLYVSTAEAAAKNSNTDYADQLRAFAESERQAIDTAASLHEYLRSERVFHRIFYRLSANPVLNLFLEIIFDLAAFQTEGVWRHHPDRIDQARRLRLKLSEAVLDGDEEMAKVAARRLSAAILQWFDADHADGSHPVPTDSRLSQSAA